MPDEATTYITFVTFGNDYKPENRTLYEDIREVLETSKGQLVDAYAPVAAWDAMIIADFANNLNAIKFRFGLKALGMWKVETIPTGTVKALTEAIQESKVHATRK